MGDRLTPEQFAEIRARAEKWAGEPLPTPGTMMPGWLNQAKEVRDLLQVARDALALLDECAHRGLDIAERMPNPEPD